MPEELTYVQFKGLDDLVRLVALSPTPILQHTVIQGKHVYFVQSVAMLGRPLVYFFKADEEIGKKYVVYNRFRDEITFKEQLGSDGQSVYIPILEVEKTNLLQKTP